MDGLSAACPSRRKSLFSLLFPSSLGFFCFPCILQGVATRNSLTFQQWLPTVGVASPASPSSLHAMLFLPCSPTHDCIMCASPWPLLCSRFVSSWSSFRSSVSDFGLLIVVARHHSGYLCRRVWGFGHLGLRDDGLGFSLHRPLAWWSSGAWVWICYVLSGLWVWISTLGCFF